MGVPIQNLSFFCILIPMRTFFKSYIAVIQLKLFEHLHFYFYYYSYYYYYHCYYHFKHYSYFLLCSMISSQSVSCWLLQVNSVRTDRSPRVLHNDTDTYDAVFFFFHPSTSLVSKSLLSPIRLLFVHVKLSSQSQFL